MAYYLTNQGNGNRIDLFFGEKPSKDIRDELKENGWIWYGPAKCWYTYSSSEHINQAKEFCGISSNHENSFVAPNGYVFDWCDIGLDTSDWSEESILHKCGYNVSQEDGLTESERRNILDWVLRNRILTRVQIIDFLTAMINTRSRRPNLGIAVSKWESDLYYVRYGTAY